MNELSGKGIYIWIIKDDADVKQIAKNCSDAGLSHAAIKVADAGYTYNYSDVVGDKAAALVYELHARGIQAWGWQFVYGSAPEAEANMAIKRALELDLDGFIVNAESAYKGKHASAEIYMDKLRRALNGYCPIALSSYRFPSYHQEFPWQEFLSKVDINMPQVYWMMATNAGAQMERCYAEFKRPQYPQVPIFPTGAAFSEHGWRAYPDEVTAFMSAAQKIGVKGCNFWVYDHAYNRFPELWDAIAKFEWDGTGYEEPEPLMTLYYPCDPKWRISQYFGERPNVYTISQGHNGVDFALPVGNPIYCAWKGVVEVAVEQTNGYGRHVRVRHPFGVTIYGHLSRIDVKVDDVVEAKQVIGLSGGATSDPYSGMSTGPHLHFEIRQNEPVVPLVPGSYVYNAIDPMPYLVAHELPEAPVGVDYYLISLNGNLSLRSAPDASVSNVIGYVYATDPPYQSFERAKDARNRDWYKVTREGKVGWVAGYTQWTTITKVYAQQPEPEPPSPPVEEPTIDQRLDRIEADLDRLLDLHPEVYDNA